MIRIPTVAAANEESVFPCAAPSEAAGLQATLCTMSSAPSRSVSSYFRVERERRPGAAAGKPARSKVEYETAELAPSAHARAETEADAAIGVPAYLHENVGYRRRGRSALSREKEAAVAHALSRCSVPADFEQSSEYGTLSGSCFEDRVLVAYMWKQVRVAAQPPAQSTVCATLTRRPQLPLKPGCSYSEFCWECGKEGHFPKDCSLRLS